MIAFLGYAALAWELPPPSLTNAPSWLHPALEQQQQRWWLAKAQRRQLSGGPPGTSCSTGTCTFDCASANHQAQQTAAPNYQYPTLNGERATSAARQALNATFEPLLEAVAGCTGLGVGELLEVPFLVVLDKSWIDFYNLHATHFATQGYSTLEASPRVLFDRASYLYEKQFGIRLTVGRVEAFPGLMERCSTHNGYADQDGDSSTRLALAARGVTDTSGVEGGIVRLGVGSNNGQTYCHSYAPLYAVCSGASQAGQLGLVVNMRKPFSDSGGFVNHRAAVVLAHEIAHFCDGPTIELDRLPSPCPLGLLSDGPHLASCVSLVQSASAARTATPSARTATRITTSPTLWFGTALRRRTCGQWRACSSNS